MTHYVLSVSFHTVRTLKMVVKILTNREEL